MKDLQNHNTPGFTLMEVMLAIFMVGVLLSALLALQGKIFDGIATYSSRMNRVFLLKNRLFEVALDRAKGETKVAPEKKIDEPATVIRYESKKPSQESSLKKFNDIMIERVTAEWDEWKTKRQEVMITFLYKPEKKKE